jgi:hypothetical protein
MSRNIGEEELKEPTVVELEYTKRPVTLTTVTVPES